MEYGRFSPMVARLEKSEENKDLGQQLYPIISEKIDNIKKLCKLMNDKEKDITRLLKEIYSAVPIKELEDMKQGIVDMLTKGGIYG